MTTTPDPSIPKWRIAAEAVAVAAAGYVVAGAIEALLVRAFNPSESELEWVSDVVLATALGTSVYLWRHLRATRAALLNRERAELVLTTQLAMAAELQRRLLPQLPPAGEDVEWAARLRPAGQIGGDFYVEIPGFSGQ